MKFQSPFLLPLLLGVCWCQKSLYGDAILNAHEISSTIFDYLGEDFRTISQISRLHRRSHLLHFRDRTITPIKFAASNVELADDAISSGFYRSAVLLEAIKSDNVKVVKHLIDSVLEEADAWSLAELEWMKTIGTYCSAAKSLDVVKILFEFGFQCGRRVISNAAKRNDLPAVEWMLASGFPVSSHSFYAAAKHGNIIMLDSLSFNNDGIRAKVARNLCADAAAVGNIKTLEWAHNPPQCQCNGRVFAGAIDNGHVDVLKWAKNSGIEIPDVVDMNTAAERGYLDILKWLFDNGVVVTKSVCEFSAFGGHIQILEWMQTIKVMCDSSVYAGALISDSQDIVQWALDNHIPVDISSRDCAKIGAAGSIKALEWLNDQGVSCGQEAISAAFNNGHLNVLNWAERQGYIMSFAYWDLVFAARNGYPQSIEWAHSRGFTYERETIVTLAAFGHLALVKATFKLIKDVEIKRFIVQRISEVAVKNDKIDILKWAYAQGAVFDSDMVGYAVLNGKSSAVKLWVLSHGQSATSSTLCVFAGEGQRDFLHIAVERNALLTDDVCSAAIVANQFRVLDWMIKQASVGRECLASAIDDEGIVGQWAKLKAGKASRKRKLDE
eukprot:Partr_v1_DN28349_c0_g1_i1_m78775 putative Ankyrin Repeat Protein